MYQMLVGSVCVVGVFIQIFQKMQSFWITIKLNY